MLKRVVGALAREMPYSSQRVAARRWIRSSASAVDIPFVSSATDAFHFQVSRNAFGIASLFFVWFIFKLQRGDYSWRAQVAFRLIDGRKSRFPAEIRQVLEIP